MRSVMKIGFGALVLFTGSVALGQESEFQNKMQEDLDYYKPQLVNNCGVSDKLTIKYVGKLGSNPRERKADHNWSPSTLCGMALDAVVYSCQTSEPVKKTIAKLSSVVCTGGSGNLGYKLRGGDLTLTIDPTFKKKDGSISTPKDDLVAKLKKDLDK
jgi:hypothetical protein